jgi:pyruvate ferredoxin oxidoreductase alpha subunit
MTTKDIRSLNGNSAVAEAMRQINPDVFGFYPITPTSYIGSAFSKYVADGVIDSEYVCAESEHAALSICVGASAAGGRAVTATASQGLILMSEVLWNASGMRLPILLVNGNREVGAPLSIHCGHSDIMGVRDAGWIQIFAKNPQEAYDLTLCGFPIAEAKNVRTPIMVAMDCFHTTHTQMPVELLSDKVSAKFVGETLQMNPLLDIENPVAYGNFDRPTYFMNHKKEQLEGLENAVAQTKKIFKKFAGISGREYKVVEEIQTKDAEIIFVALGSVIGTLEVAVKKLREQGIKAGIVNPRLFRPLPDEDLRKSLNPAKKVIVLDRVYPAGAKYSPLAEAVFSVFENSAKKPEIKNVIYGLGSHETPSDKLVEIAKNFAGLSEKPTWLCD